MRKKMMFPILLVMLLVLVGSVDGAAWSTYLGGGSTDDGRGIVVDSSGNVLVTGYTQSSDLAGANNSFYGGSYDGYVANVTSGGSLSWATYIGGNAGDYSFAIAVDSLGNALITGHTLSSNLAGANNSFHGPRDAFVAKVTPSGTLVWSTYLGGSGDDYAFSIALDSSDNVFITGHTYSSNFAGAINSFHGGSHDAYIAKVTSSGTLVWARFLGGSSLDYGYGVATDSSGNALITGHTQSSNFAGAINSFHGGSYDAFVAKVTSSGSLSWATYIGGSSSDYGHAIALDSSGNPFVTGWTSSSNFVGANNSFHGGSRDSFVTRLTSDGTLVWATYLGGSDIDDGHGIVLDSSDNALLTGYTFSHDFAGANNSFHGATVDCFAAKVASSGSLLYSTYIGGSGNDQARAIAVNSSDEPLITGETTSLDIANSINSYYGGSHDAFAAKIVESPPPTGVTVRGTVYDAATADQGLSGATVSADGKETQTHSDGEYELTGLPAGRITASARLASYETQTQVVDSAEAGQTYTVDFQLVPQGHVVTDTGFRPEEDGFKFANPAVPVVDDILKVGYCTGFTYTALLLYVFDIAPPEDDTWDAESPIGKAIVNAHIAFNLNPETLVKEAELLSYNPYGGFWMKPNLDQIQIALSTGRPCPLILAPTLFPLDGLMHSVLAYKLVEFPQQPDGTIPYYIYVYNNRHPALQSPIGVRCRDDLCVMLNYEEFSRFITHPFPGQLTELLLGIYGFELDSPASLTIIDPTGSVLDNQHSEISGGYYRVLHLNDDEHEEQLVIILWPEEGEYLVSVIPDPCAEPNETYTLAEYKFGVKTVFAEDVEIQDVPVEPYVSVALIPATVDMEPDSVGCDEQYITAFIELPDNYIPAEIDANTVYLHTYNAPFSVFAESLPREIGDYDSDGIQDLVVEFDRAGLIVALEDPEEGQNVELGLAGHLWDGTRFEGSDVVTLTLVDNTPPEFNLSVIPDTLWPPNHKMVQITPSWTATDLCDIDPNVSLVSIVMNEGDETSTYDPSFDDTVGDGHTTADIQIVDGDIYLRAERSGKGIGRIYTITYQATDDSGNTAVATVTVTVPHDQP